MHSNEVNLVSFGVESGFLCASVIFSFSYPTHLDRERLLLSLEWDLLLRGLLDLLLLLERDCRRDRLLERLRQSTCLQKRHQRSHRVTLTLRRSYTQNSATKCLIKPVFGARPRSLLPWPWPWPRMLPFIILLIWGKKTQKTSTPFNKMMQCGLGRSGRFLLKKVILCRFSKQKKKKRQKKKTRKQYRFDHKTFYLFKKPHFRFIYIYLNTALLIFNIYTLDFTLLRQQRIGFF